MAVDEAITNPISALPWSTLWWLWGIGEGKERLWKEGMVMPGLPSAISMGEWAFLGHCSTSQLSFAAPDHCRAKPTAAGSHDPSL